MNTDFKANRFMYVYMCCFILISCFLFTSVSHAAATDFITGSDYYVDNSGHYPNGDSVYNPQSGNWVGSAADPFYGEAQAAVKFDLSSLAGTVAVSDAQLKIYVNDILGTPDLYKLYGSNTDGWQETATTIPSKDTLLNTNNGAIAKNQWITVNVTSFVQQQMSTDKIISFVLTGNTSGDKSFNFNSKESASNKPTLSVTYTTLSSNANLSGLTLSSGALSPAFASGTTSYTANVGSGVSILDITPTVADSTATVKVNTVNAISGSPSSVTLSPGPNTIHVAVTAQDGTVKTYTVTVTVASTPVQSITVTGAANATSVNKGSTLQMNAAVSPLNATDASVTWSVTSGTGTATIDATGLLTATGIGTVTVKATANDGSKTEGSIVITIIGDTTPPVTTAVYSAVSPPSPSTEWQLSDIQLTLSATDDMSGVKLTEYRVNGGVWNVYAAPILLSQDGTFTYEFRSTDNAGNVENTRSIELKLDKTAPATKYHFDPIYAYDKSGRTYIAGYTTTLRAADNAAGSGVAGIQYRINGGAWIPYGSPFTLYAGVTHTVEYYSTDIAGNVEQPMNKMDFDHGTFTGAGKF